MASIYDLFGLVFGAISLLSFWKHVVRLISSFLPPARVRILEDTIAEMRTLVDRLEGRTNGQTGGIAQDWADHRERLNEFAQSVSDLWLDVKRWENLGIARIYVPLGTPELRRLCGDLKRKIDDCHRHLLETCLYVSQHPSGPLSRSSSAATLVVSASTSSQDADSTSNMRGRSQRKHTIKLYHIGDTPCDVFLRTISGLSGDPPDLLSDSDGDSEALAEADPAGKFTRLYLSLFMRDGRLRFRPGTVQNPDSCPASRMYTRLDRGEVKFLPQMSFRSRYKERFGPDDHIYFGTKDNGCISLAHALRNDLDNLVDKDLDAFPDRLQLRNPCFIKVHIQLMYYPCECWVLHPAFGLAKSALSRAKLAYLIACATTRSGIQRPRTDLIVDHPKRTAPLERIFLWRLRRVERDAWQPEYYVERPRAKQ